MSEHVWTDVQFESMSWHDNHVHALRIVEGENGDGDLILDLDHIVEWINQPDYSFQFRILPVTLTFHGVMFPRISLDYATPTAAFGPFMIYGIKRHSEQRANYVAQLWKILVTWPNGEITFEARGFTQRGLGEALLSNGQCLAPEQRTRAG